MSTNLEKRIAAKAKFDLAAQKLKKAKEHYEKVSAEFHDLSEKIRKKEYYSISGIKVDIPFVASSNNQAKIMVEMAGDVAGKKIADLGSGDGKILFKLAQKGAKVYGYELEPRLIEKTLTRFAGSHFQYKIYNQNFFDADLSGYDMITLYGITSMMEKLEEKLSRELKKGASIISNTFIFPNWKPAQEMGGVFRYVKNE